MNEQDKGSFDPLNQSTAPASVPSERSAEQDLAAASRLAGSMTHEFIPTTKPPIPLPEKSGGHRNLIISMAALLILAIGAGGIYWFILHHKSAGSFGAVPPTAAQSQPAQSQSAASQITSATKSYTSPNFNLSFSYPQDWTVTDNGGGIMTVKSPLIKLKNASGQTVSGSILLTIRSQGQKLTEFNSGNATAVRDSVKIAYTNPTQTQRANTYISFLQYASTSTLGALDGVYITADNGYQKGQAIPSVDVQKVDPLISLTFFDSNAKPLSITSSMWDNQDFAGPLTKILQSFSIT